MQASDDEQGTCPGCEDPGPVGAPCPRAVCTRRGLHFVPPAYLTRRGNPDPLVGRVIDSYLVVRLLGEGGFGKVFLALQLPILMRAAVKILHQSGDPEEQRRHADKFIAEARALAALTHPNIVRLLQFGAFEDTAYLAMEFVDGGLTLRELAQRRQAAGEPLTLSEIGRILGQVLDALQAAHAKNIVHRDIKPENIMVQSVPGHPLFVRVLDFGLAKFVSDTSQTSAAIGTPVYMAPEQVTRRHIGPWTDIYAVGALAWELITGRRLYEGAEVHEIFAKKLDARGDPLAGAGEVPLPAPTRDFFREALAFEHSDRIQDVPTCRTRLDGALAAMAAPTVPSAAQPAAAGSSPPRPEVDPFATRVEPVSEEAPVRPPPVRSTDTVDPPRRRARRRLWIGLAIAAVIVGLGVAVALVALGGRPRDEVTLARALPGDAMIYVRVEAPGRLRERLLDAPGLARADALRRALEPRLAEQVGELARGLGLEVATLWDVIERARRLELGVMWGEDPVVMLHLDGPEDELVARALREVRAEARGPDRWRLPRSELDVLRQGDVVVVGRPVAIGRVLAPPVPSLAEREELAVARERLGESRDIFVWERPPRPGELGAMGLVELLLTSPSWLAVSATGDGRLTMEVDLPPGRGLGPFLDRPDRPPGLVQSLPRGAVLVWSTQRYGRSEVPERIGGWVDALPGPLAQNLRRELRFDVPRDESTRPLDLLDTITLELLRDPLPVGDELALALVRDDDARLGPLIAFDVASQAAAERFIAERFEAGPRAQLPWQMLTIEGARVRFVDLEQAAVLSAGTLSPDYRERMDTRLGFTLHEGVFAVGGVDALRAFLMARAGRAPRLGEVLDASDVDPESALRVIARVGDFAHGPRAREPGIAELQETLSQVVTPAASYTLTARFEPWRIRVRTSLPVVTLGVWLGLEEARAPRPEPEPPPPAPEDLPPGHPPIGEDASPRALTDEQLVWPLERADGTRTTLAEETFGDRPLLITFGESTCTPCLEEAPLLDKLASWLDDRWRFVHVGSDPAWTDALRAAAARARVPGAERLVLRDGRAPDSTLRATFDIRLVPETLLVYRRQVIGHWKSPQPWHQPALVAEVIATAERHGLPAPEPGDVERDLLGRFVSGGELVLEDRMDWAPRPEWRTEDGWEVVDGALRSKPAVASRLWLDVMLPDPGRVELTVTASTGGTACWVGGARAREHVDLTVMQGAEGADVLGRVPATPGEPERLVVRPSRFEPERRYVWSIIRSGGTTLWLVDGELVAWRTDEVPAAGRELGCNPGPIVIDDVRVWALTP